MITNKQIIELLDKHRETDKSFETDEWYLTTNNLIDTLKKEIKEL